jgi:hypothetical protein
MRRLICCVCRKKRINGFRARAAITLIDLRKVTNLNIIILILSKKPRNELCKEQLHKELVLFRANLVLVRNMKERQSF